MDNLNEIFGAIASIDEAAKQGERLVDVRKPSGGGGGGSGGSGGGCTHVCVAINAVAPG